MDQTPVFFTSHYKQTLEMIWVNTVIIQMSPQDTRWATLSVTVSADGTKLPPISIFKGKQSGRIASKEFPTFSAGCEYFCQENE